MTRNKKKLTPHKKINGYKFKNLTFLLISFILAIYMVRNEVLHEYLLHLGNLEYIGAFFAGFFFVSTFTIAPASIVLYILTDSLPVWSIALVAGFGAVLGDTTIFQYIRQTNLVLHHSCDHQ